MEINQAINWMDKVTIVFSFLTMVGVFWNLWKKTKQMEKIKIYFIKERTKEKVLIDENLARKDCLRSEIQGILRTKLQKGFPRYEIDYVGTDKYFENIYKIQAEKSDELLIYLKDDELQQFGIK